QIVQQDLLIAHALLVSAAFPECWYTHAVAAEAFGAITATPVRAVASATTIMPTCRAVMCRSPRPRAAADVAVFLLRNLRFSILFPLCRLRWSTRRECHGDAPRVYGVWRCIGERFASKHPRCDGTRAGMVHECGICPATCKPSASAL